MEIKFEYTMAGIILEVNEWDWDTESVISSFYHIFEDSCNGPFIGYCYINEIIELETEDNIFLQFDAKNKIWKPINPKKSIILQNEALEPVNNQLKIWYALHGPPVKAT